MFIFRNRCLKSPRLLGELSTQLSVGLLLAFSIVASGCGANPFISNFLNQVSVKSYEKDQKNWLDLTAKISPAGFSMSSIRLPITGSDGLTSYGSILITPGTTNSSITIALDLTETLKQLDTQTEKPLLPNGTPLLNPDLQQSTVHVLSVGSTDTRTTTAKIYFALDSKLAVLGFALPFSALDPTGNYSPGMDLFFPTRVNNIDLTVGIFSSQTDQTGGIAVFADITPFFAELETLPELQKSLD